MIRITLFLFVLLSVLNVSAQSRDELAVRKVLSTQSAAWNRGDKEKFMIGYWQNDSMMFIGKSGVNYGWNATLENYKKGYPDTAAMGKLQFTLLHLKQLSPEYYFVIGKWHLTRTAGNLEGHFTLLFRKINGQWQIIADHSS